MKNFYLKSMGCKSNQFEGQIVSENLIKAGYNQVNKLANRSGFNPTKNNNNNKKERRMGAMKMLHPSYFVMFSRRGRKLHLYDKINL